MYQALYRKWRPRTFDDVVGQEHITGTLKQQILGDRLSHAYLFTGTRGTGKTSCAKILSRAVNCHAPINGNPCNTCPACIGIENGSILDVLELDAASNNGVDQVRALRDEAVYTPAAVRRRVYIVDEVHMLSTPAFNALLKILEEPPPHLMFILATTELHKVPATIRSRCQQFAFKRILPTHIATRLSEVATHENIPLSSDGADLLARLADGGLRDALSLLDQCANGTQTVDEVQVLETLGLAGNVETARLMTEIAQRDSAKALDTFGRLYMGGKDISSLLGELSALTRDLLLRKTAPKAGTGLLTGGYDEMTMRTLGEVFTPQRLLYILRQLQDCSARLSMSANRRTDGELCLLRLCDESLDESVTALSARIAELEALIQNGIPAHTVAVAAPRPVVVERPAPVVKPVVQPVVPSVVEELPPWAMDEPPMPDDDGEMVRDWGVPDAPVAAPKKAVVKSAPTPKPPAPRPAPAPVTPLRVEPVTAPSQMTTGEDTTFWRSFCTGLTGKIPPSIKPYVTNPAKVGGSWRTGVLTLWVDSPFTKAMLDKPANIAPIAEAATAHFGGETRVMVQVGKPPVMVAVTAPPAFNPTPPAPVVIEEVDALDALLAFGAQFDNVTIKD